MLQYFQKVFYGAARLPPTSLKVRTVKVAKG